MYTYTINDVAKLLNKTVPEIRSDKHIDLEDLSTVTRAYSSASRVLRNAKFEYVIEKQRWALSWEDMRGKIWCLGVKPAFVFNSEYKSITQEWPRNMYDSFVVEYKENNPKNAAMYLWEKVEYCLSAVPQLYGRFGVATVQINGAPVLDHEGRPHTFVVDGFQSSSSLDLVTGGNPPRGSWISTWNPTENY